REVSERGLGGARLRVGRGALPKARARRNAPELGGSGWIHVVRRALWTADGVRTGDGDATEADERSICRDENREEHDQCKDHCEPVAHASRGSTYRRPCQVKQTCPVLAPRCTHLSTPCGLPAVLLCPLIQLCRCAYQVCIWWTNANKERRRSQYAIVRTFRPRLARAPLAREREWRETRAPEGVTCKCVILAQIS